MLTAVRTNPVQARLALAIAAASLAPLAQADFIEDSHATLQTQNIYLNRDFREGTGQSKREEWSQGFLLNIESGFTEGTVGFGLDAMGMLGIKLDSGGGRTGTDLLPVHDDGSTPDEFSRLGLTAKAKSPKPSCATAATSPKPRWSRPATAAPCPRCSRAPRWNPASWPA